MKEIYYAVKAEVYRFLHSKLLAIHIGVPLLGIGLFCSYYSYAPWKDEDKIFAYLQAIVLAFPLLIAVIVAMSYDDEKEAAQFARMLTVPYRRSVIHLSKLVVLIQFGILATFGAIFGFGVISRIMGNQALNGAGYVGMFIAILGSQLCLYILQYVVSFRWGKGFGLGLGVLNVLMSALMYTGLGDRIWYFFPCAWGIRMISYLAESSIYHRGSTFIRHELIKGCGTMGLMTILSLVVFMIWADKWQGVKAQD